MGPVSEATVEETETGKAVTSDGWFVLNLAEASWERDSHYGVWCKLESDDAPFPHYGVNVHVVMPGQVSGRYHAETNQEGFLVLAGECMAIVEGEERPLRQWDYLHCPPGTTHIIVGAGDGPCAVLMTGMRDPDAKIHYPVDPVAERYGASVPRATDSPRDAYADLERTQHPERSAFPFGAAPLR